MKKLPVLLFLTFIFYGHLQSQKNVWENSTHIAGQKWDICNAIASGENSTLYVAGSFIGHIKIGKNIVRSKGDRDIFIAKLDDLGNVLWLKRMGSPNSDYVFSMNIGANGNLYLVALLGAQADLAEKSLDTKKTTSILFKLNQNGELIDKVNLSNEAEVLINSVKLDGKGNLFVFGSFKDKLVLGKTELISQGKTDVFLAKLNPNLESKFIKQFGNEFSDQAYALEIDKKDRVNISFSSSNKKIAETKATDKLIKIVQLNNDGTRITEKEISGKNLQIKVLLSDLDTNLYVVGKFRKNIEVEGVEFSSNGRDDIFILKYNKDSKFLWSKQIGGISHDGVSDALITAKNNIVLAGNFRRELIFEHVKINAVGRFSDLFVVQYQPDGKINWVQKAGSTENDIAGKLVKDKHDNLYLSSTFTRKTEVRNLEIISRGQEDILITKLFNCDLSTVEILGDTILCEESSAILETGDYQAYTWNDTIFGKQKLEIISPGKYTLKVTDSLGCTSQDSVSIRMQLPPEIDLGQDQIIDTKQSLWLSTEEKYAYYLWQDGSKSPSYFVSPSFIGSGKFEFSLKVTDKYGCQSIDTVLVEILENQELEDNNLCITDIKVFPNPNNGNFEWYVDVDNRADLNIEIWTMDSRLIYTEKHKGYIPFSKKRISLKNTSKGVYYLRVYNKNWPTIKKIVIE